MVIIRFYFQCTQMTMNNISSSGGLTFVLILVPKIGMHHEQTKLIMLISLYNMWLKKELHTIYMMLMKLKPLQLSNSSVTCEQGTPQNFILAFINELWKTWKITILGKRKTIAGDIIILHMCTKKYNHMRYSPWDTE